MDSRIISGSIVAAVLVLALVAMYLGWRRRQNRQSGLPTPHPVPENTGVEAVSFDDVLYVATTMRDDPLDRVAVHGLGFRARASVAVVGTGVILDLAGADPVFIPAADLIDVGRSTWTIDRVVESDGLVRITWRLGTTAVDSYLRVTADDPAELIDAIAEIIETLGVGNESI